ncbi:unnamed protein product [Pipistrellus nathusii]|uniref:Uncharacterized protein n=1 Tax=Pipistrellus nathusii TaxID=59473 RepID=A0ABN9ZQX7_PIPNA
MGKLNMVFDFVLLLLPLVIVLMLKCQKMILLLLFPCSSSAPRYGVCPPRACVCPAGREESACGQDSLSLPAHPRCPGLSQSRGEASAKLTQFVQITPETTISNLSFLMWNPFP